MNDSSGDATNYMGFYSDIKINKRVINSLKSVLDREKYHEFKIFSILKKDSTLKWRYENFEKYSKHPLLKLFLLNRDVDINEIKTFIPNKAIEMFRRINLLNVVNKRVSSHFTIFAYNDKYILTDNFWCKKKSNDYVFTGETSFFLLKKIEDILLFPVENVIDLGSGSGIILFALYEKYKRGIGIDINKRAVKLAYTNILLNQLKLRKIKFINGDWRNYLKPNSFDLIVANFPFAPVPSSISYPIYANGGETGFDFLKNEFNNIYKSLKMNGSFIFLTGSIGNERESLLIKLINSFIKDKSMNFSLTELARSSVEKYVTSDTILSKHLNTILNFYQKKGYNYVYLYFGFLKKVKNELNLRFKKRKFGQILNFLNELRLFNKLRNIHKNLTGKIRSYLNVYEKIYKL
jgi:methylase of polypeptide subunit release factors